MDAEVSRQKFEQAVVEVRAAAEPFGWVVHSATYPVLEVTCIHPKTGREVGFRYLCDVWDAQPPSLALFDPKTGTELPGTAWPEGGWSWAPSHPTTGRPFLCLPGIYEYHIHPSHAGEGWEPLKARGTYKLVDIVLRVKQRFGDTNG